MIKFILVNWIITFVISMIKGVSLSKYLEENGIKKVRHTNVADIALDVIACGVPIFNWVIICVLLFVDNEDFAEILIEKGIYVKR